MTLEFAIIIPTYNCENCLEVLVSKIDENMKNKNFKIFFVDDYSIDGTWKKLKELKKKKDIHGVKLNQNVGQHLAISAGLELIEAENYIIMDCDLQHDPKYLINIIDRLKSNKEIIFTFGERKHSFLKNLVANIFYKFNKIISKSAEKPTHEYQNFVGFKKIVRDEILKIKFRNRHLLFILRSFGFKSEYMRIEHNKRFEGESSYNLKKLLFHAISGIFIDLKKLSNFIIITGGVMLLIFFSIFIILLSSYFASGFLSGWFSIILVQFFLISLFMIVGGLILLGLCQILDEIKLRPLYTVDDKLD